MPGATRLNDMSVGHADFPSRPNIQASSDVIINNKGAVRLGDGWAVHCNHHPTCHDGKSSSSSKTVIINNKGSVRIGDSISCGDKVAQGSNNVIIGD